MTSAATTGPGSVRPRHLLLLATVALTVIGALAVLSAADGASSGSPFTFFAKAAGFGALGLILMAYLGRGGFGGVELAYRASTVLLILGFAGVIFVLLPTPITPTINGAKRWIQLPGMTIQPSEILKPALVLHLAMVLAREPWRVRSLRLMQGPLLICGVALAIVAKEDLGSALVTSGVVLIVLFAAAMPGRVLGSIVGIMAAGATMLTLIAPERLERLAVFLHPFEDRFGAGFQITHGFLAIGSGGVTGRGIGTGLEKHIIPEPQTDFILPVIMEEIGLIGATLIIALYVAIVLLGLRIARGTKDPYERLVATGLTAIIMCQAALNLWVVFGIAPLTGVPLPLISAGGTSQVILLSVIGLLLDIDRRSQQPTVSLVVPVPAPRAVRREGDPVPPDPQPGELRVLDQRPAADELPSAQPATPGTQRMGGARLGRALRVHRAGKAVADDQANAQPKATAPAAHAPQPRSAAPAPGQRRSIQENSHMVMA
ncbi:MAG: FtsW/RodA/SpoVE family cell cycle protein [Solirubrobacteraceae bacterium]|nr:FtsW/RodA/SpoVE family cell cycle protein [Solirubrobacteraceae bacterium]